MARDGGRNHLSIVVSRKEQHLHIE
jgi:hypothetical protein